MSTSSPIFAARSLPIPGSASRSPGAERGDLIGMMRDGLRGVAIRPDLERVLVLDFEEIADLGEDPRDGEIVHAGGSGCVNTIVYIMRRCRSATPSGKRASSRSRGSPATVFHPIFARWRRSSTSAASSSLRATSSPPSRSPSIAREAQTLARELPLWVSVDQEGGRVARLRSPFTLWPPMQTLGRSGDETLAERFARSLAAELRAVGVTLDFTPVLDILTNPKNPVDRRSGIGRDAGRRRQARDGHHQDPAGEKASPPAASTFPGTAIRASTPTTSCRSSSIRPIGWRRSSSCRSGRRLPPAWPAS